MSKQSQLKELGNFVQAAYLDMPAALVQQASGGNAEALKTAGWKTYDAWVALTNETTNRVYENAAFGSVIGRAMESALRVQQIGSALASAFFGNLWPAIGLPTTNQINALRSEIAELRDSLEQRKAAILPIKSDDGLHLVRSNAHVKHPAEDKEDAAA